jgi:hypothetical protein
MSGELRALETCRERRLQVNPAADALDTAPFFLLNCHHANVRVRLRKMRT